MSFVRSLLCSIVLRSVIGSPQINLHLTDWVSDHEDDVVFQHDCLNVAALIEKESDPHQIISYCLTDWPSKWTIQDNSFDQKFTFAELCQQNITSQQLYIWSAPMDVIERYQLYLNHLSTSDESHPMASQLFYNCTSPRFGPLCQYSMDYHASHHSSLATIIQEFYEPEYIPTSLTCYTHLECNRGSTSACLDWTEICDGHIDCLNDGIDETQCWQLEMNECEKNEYRCDNGQCIPITFVHGDVFTHECLDRSDPFRDKTESPRSFNGEPTISVEDITYSMRHFQFNVQLTSSCVPERDRLLREILFFDKPKSLSETCWLAFKCHFGIPYPLDPICDHICSNKVCRQVINETCPDIIIVAANALVFGHMYVAYLKVVVIYGSIWIPPQYVCYNDQLCSGFYPNRTLLTFNNTTCRRPEDFPVRFSVSGKVGWIDTSLRPLFTELHRCNTIIYNDSAICNSTTMYRCHNSSKCISKYRLCDDVIDCDYKDDEQCPLINGTCSPLGSETLFKCLTSNRCISSKLVGNDICDCELDEYGLCEDESFKLNYIRKHISFPTICDGFTELAPILIDGRNETDETECEHWHCNNTYTRCDGFWNCFDGADEVDCNPLPILKCPLHHHLCISPETYQLTCLPIAKANDGKIDCVGATDELKLCRANNHELSYENFHCKNDTIRPCILSLNLCNNGPQCMHKDDEPFCNQTRNSSTFYSVCSYQYASLRTDALKFLCARLTDKIKLQIVHFSLNKMMQSESRLIIQDRKTRASITSTTRQDHQDCHRGLPLRVWLNSDRSLTTEICLCPPSFYGNMCQYQNQRVSLTMQFRTYSHSRRTLFAMIVSLIDDSNERIIHSYQQLTYFYIHHCQTKFNVYLLYSSRPKHPGKHYSVHIDIYEKMTFAYRGSFLIPLNYSFLPVHRIAVQLNIPRISDNMETCSDQHCLHGRCIKYSDNRKDTTFCQCDQGWSGKYCTRPHMCTCSPDSLCLGVSANNRSICVCPVNRFGTQCLLYNTACQSDQNAVCNNGSECISVDEHMVSNKTFFCICPKGFSGEKCEIADNKIMVSFHKNIILPSVMLVHFIEVFDNNTSPENGSTFKSVPLHQNSVVVQWSRPFHIAFAELFDNKYYLMIVQKTYNQSSIIQKTIDPSDRCEHISVVLNETIAQFHLLRRIKYYHLPCQRNTPLLSCFYDDSHFCLCNNYGHQRVANCFEFNPSIKHDCFGQSNCENGAQCLQDKSTCPQTSMCVCPKCFYGTRCQFSSSLFGLSLDAILGYHIQPHINMQHQPRIVTVSVALTTIIMIVGFVNGVLSVVTFKNKEARTVGCGFYLLGSSITTLLIVTMFALKFWILIITQMAYTTNRSFLNVQCHSIDFLLRICLTMDKWLNACVAMERVFAVTKGVNFNKKKSKQMAKYIIYVLIFLSISTAIHDPIHRRLLADNTDADADDEKRIWCIVTYSMNVQIFDTFINMFHFFAPFAINIISAVIIIVMTARQRTHIENHQTYRHLLSRQLQQHYHLLIAPLLLIILALPRLIISFVSDCMISTDDSWLFLAGYFVSFIPPMLCFVVFVLPSKLYKAELRMSVFRYRQAIQSRLHIVLSTGPVQSFLSKRHPR